MTYKRKNPIKMKCPECGAYLKKANNHGKLTCPSNPQICSVFDGKINRMGAFVILSRAGVSYPQRRKERRVPYQ